MKEISLDYIDIINVEQEISSANKYIDDGVLINIEHVKWIDSFGFIILCAWIQKNKNKKIEIKIPTKGNVGDQNLKYNFLKKNNFLGFLQSIGIQCPNLPIANYEQPIEFAKNSLPIKFFNKKNLEQLLVNYDMQSSLLKIATNSQNVRNIGVSGIKSVIIQEVCKNAYEHGKDLSCLSVWVISQNDTQLRSSEIVHNRVKYAPIFLKDFYAKIGSDDFVQIIVSDYGSGIYKTLKNSYLEDEIISNKKEKPNHRDLIEYAFELHSSSKDAYFEKIDTGRDWEEYVPPRGLFFVKGLVKNNNGIIIVRSGTSYFGYDFYTKETGKKFSNIDDDRIKKLISLPGVQISIIIPLNQKKDSLLANKLYWCDKKYEPSSLIQTISYKVNKRFQEYQTIGGLISNLHKKIKLTKKQKLVLIDFEKVSWDKDKLYPFLMELLYLSSDHYKIILMNCEKICEEIILIEKYPPKQDVFNKTRPVLMASMETYPYSIKSISSSDVHNEICNKTISSIINKKEINYEIPEYLNHIFVKNKFGIQFSFNFDSLFSVIQNYNVATLRDALLNENNKIFHENYFMLPNKAFLERFYEIGAIFKKTELIELLTRIFVYELYTIDKKSICILSISQIGNKIGEAIIGSYQRDEHNIDHINSEDPILNPSLILRLKEYDAIVVVVDVIATGNSLRSVLKSLEHRLEKICKIYAVVDLREQSENDESSIICNNKIYSVKSFLLDKQKIYIESKPSDWDWKSIITIDKNQWVPIHHLPFTYTIYDSIDFLGMLYENSIITRKGHHIVSNSSHIPYFFLVRHIFDTFGDEFSLNIYERIEKYKELKGNITHIFVAKHTHGIKEFSKQLEERFDASVEKILSTSLPLTKEQYENVESVILLDTSISSGATIWNMLYAISSLKPKHIWIFVLMNRAPLHDARKLWYLSSYKNIDVTFTDVSYLPIPQYTPNSCPLCLRAQALDEFHNDINFTSLYDVIKKYLIDLEPIEVHPETDLLSDQNIDKDLIHKILSIRVHFQKMMDGDRESQAIFYNIIENSAYNSQDFLSLTEMFYFEICFFKNHSDILLEKHKKIFYENCIKLIQDNVSYGYKCITNIIFLCFQYLSNDIATFLSVVLHCEDYLMFVFAELFVFKRLNKDFHEQCDCLLNSIIKHCEFLSGGKPKGLSNYKNLHAISQIKRYLDQVKFSESLRTESQLDFSNHPVIIILNCLNTKSVGNQHDDLCTFWSRSLGMFHYYEDSTDVRTFIDRTNNILFLLNKIYSALTSSSYMSRLVSESDRYFQFQFAHDLNVLDKYVRSLQCLLPMQSKEEVDLVWNNSQFQQSINKIREKIIENSGELRKIISNQFTNLSTFQKHVEAFRDNQRSLRGIEINFSGFENCGHIFISSDTFYSIVDNLLQNAINGAFVVRPEQQLSLFQNRIDFKCEVDGRSYILNYYDNGRGMSEKESAKLNHRYMSLLEFYNAYSNIQSTPGNTHCSFTFLKRETVL